MSQKKKKGRDSVFRGNSSGRFLHGPPLKRGINIIIDRPSGRKKYLLGDLASSHTGTEEIVQTFC